MPDNIDHPKHWRAGEKNKETEIEDLKKAIWYIEREIKRVENE